MAVIWRRACAAVAGVALLAVLAGCDGDRARGLQQVGATLDPVANMPAALVHPCPGQAVAAVSLWSMNKTGSDRDRELWRVASTGGASTSGTTRVVVGQTPSGFREEVLLAGQIPKSAELQFVVEVGGPVSVRFRSADLRSDAVVVDPAWFGNHHQVSAARFEQENRKDCGSG